MSRLPTLSSPGIAEAGMHSYAFKRIGASATEGDPGEPSPGIAEAGMHSYAFKRNCASLPG